MTVTKWKILIWYTTIFWHFSLEGEDSFSSIPNMWVPEMKKLCPGVPIMLVSFYSCIYSLLCKKTKSQFDFNKDYTYISLVHFLFCFGHLELGCPVLLDCPPPPPLGPQFLGLAFHLRPGESSRGSGSHPWTENFFNFSSEIGFPNMSLRSCN